MVNDDPFKLIVLHALTDAMKAIAPAAGFRHDLADFDRGDGVMQPRVFRGRMWFGDNDPIPMVSVLEGVNPADEVVEQPVDSVTGEYDWPLIVQWFVDDDPQNPTDPAYRLGDDVRRCLIQQATRRSANRRQVDPLGLGNVGSANVSRVVSMKVGPGVVRPADDVSSKAYGWLTLVIRLVERCDS